MPESRRLDRRPRRSSHAELAELFVERNTYVLPSLYLGVYQSKSSSTTGRAYARKSLPMGVKAGVKFVTGDDFGLLETPHGDNSGRRRWQ